MNSNDVNSVINNLCDKLGTTASKLIPEMAGYQIASSDGVLLRMPARLCGLLDRLEVDNDSVQMR